MTLNLINIYGPNSDDPMFYKEIESLIDEENFDYNLICGDLNLVLNPDLDLHNYKNINNPRARQFILNMISEQELCDIYRQFFPEKKRYTWRRKNPIKQARLDYFLASKNILDIVKSCQINPGYRSDHSILRLDIMLNRFECGKGVWKFNNSLLRLLLTGNDNGRHNTVKYDTTRLFYTHQTRQRTVYTYITDIS